MSKCLYAAAMLYLGCAIVDVSQASPDSVVVFNEIQYNPQGTSEAGEWIELFNQMGIKVDVSGWRIDGVGYTFPPGTILNPGAYVVVAKTPVSGQMGPFVGTIDNGGETLRLINHSDRMMDEVEINDNLPWPVGPDNSGSTLAKLSPYTASGEASDWTASSQTDGTPGAVNFPSPPSAVGLRFNEIQASSAVVYGLEIVNTSGSPIDAAGVIVSAEADPLREYTIPAVTLAPGDFLWLDEATLGYRPAQGNKIFLYSPAKSSVLDAREATNRLRGRSEERQGAWLYPDAVTPGAANAFAFSDSVVISEVQYNPPAMPALPPVPAVYQTLSLIAHGGIWRYNASDDNMPFNWSATTHPVAGNWKSGPSPIGRETDAIPVPLATTVSSYTSATVTYYFEREFTITQEQLDSLESLQMVREIDDGAVFYLNGVEVDRFNIPAGVVGPETQASPSVGNASLLTTTLPVTALVAGTNRISVEVHQVHTTSSDIVFGLKLDANLVITPAVSALPMRESNNQWIEIANRSANLVDLSGWSLEEGVNFVFPPGTMLDPGEHACVVRDPLLFASAYPSARILGTFSGSLARSGEKLVLADPWENPADELRYHDGGKWPEFADGGGSSMELKDLDADNSVGGAWAASDESGSTAWENYTYSAVAAESKGQDSQWAEFNLGLLSAGEIWIDDVSVIENGSTQKLADTTFNNAALWRLRGNHRHSEIISEPGNLGNKILRIVATGPTEHMHNQIETTLASSISNGATYQISFRARWVTGMNQLHTRLYFNRVAKMNIIDRPADPGTPSAPNSRAVANDGPTYSSLRHSPAVPAVSQATTISAHAADPDAVTNMTLFYSVNGASFVSIAMSHAGGGLYQGTIPGRSAGSVVQFYVRGTDSLGAITYHPAAGSASRALYEVNDGTAATNGLHNFRIITTNADRDFMHTATEVMSNDRIEGTVINREGDIYYGAGVRLKSSERGRNNLNRVGYNIDFPPDGLFRGAHAGVAVDRSEGQMPGQRELLFDMMISNSGGPISRYYDLIKVLAPNSSLTGSAVLQMARYEDVFLEEQFDNGGDGTLYEYELIYYPLTTDGSGKKLPEPDAVRGVAIANQGDDIESYRWNFLNKINREAENFEPIINYCKLFSLSGAAFEEGIQSTIDLDTWFRGMAYGVLSGAGDNASAGAQHNGIYYAKPDGKVIFLPHDMDYSFDSNRSIYANPECNTLTDSPARNRQYLGHLHDIISTTYNNSYMSIWTNHFATLDPAQDWSAELTYMTNRSNSVLSQINSQIAPVGFSITTPSPLVIGTSTATVEGNGWVNVRDIRIAGSNTPLALTWTGANTWLATVPAAPGANTVTLEALDFSGAVIGSAAIVIDSTTIIEPAAAGNIVVSEIMYHPSDPTVEELNAGFTDAEQFEFIELMNISGNQVNMTSVTLSVAMNYSFASGITLDAGARVIIARDRAAFLQRYPSLSGLLADGQFLSGTLNNAGETLVITGTEVDDIQNFTYDDVSPWPMEADGSGYSVVLISPGTNPDHSLATNWRASSLPGGNPGIIDSQPFTGIADADEDFDGLPALVEYAIGSSDVSRNASGVSMTQDMDGFVTVTYSLNVAADEVVSEIQSSEDMLNWNSDFSIVSETPDGEGNVVIVVRSLSPASAGYFIRLQVQTR